MTEHALDVDIADDVVDRPLPHENAGVLALDETFAQLVHGAVRLHGLHIHARNHAVAREQVREIEGFLKDPDLVLLFGLSLGILLQEIFQIDFLETPDPVAVLHPHSEQTEQTERKPRREPGDRVKKDIKEIERNGKRLQVDVGPQLDQGLGRELPDKDDDYGGDERFEQHGARPRSEGNAPHVGQRMDDQRHVERIEHQHDVVAHQHGGDVLPGVVGEHIGDPAEHAVLLAVYLQFEFVGAGKGDLHAGKKRRQQQRHHRYDNDRSHHSASSAFSDRGRKTSSAPGCPSFSTGFARNVPFP